MLRGKEFIISHFNFIGILVQAAITQYHSMMAYKQQKYIFHGFGGWNIKAPALLVLLLLVCRLWTFHCVSTYWEKH